MAFTKYPHPFTQLSIDETNLARDVVLACHPDVVLDFRNIFLLEPPKVEVLKYLELEHAGQLNEATVPPARLAQVWYDVISAGAAPQYNESIVDLRLEKRVGHEIVNAEFQPNLTISEFETTVNVCKASPLFQSKLASFNLPDGFEIVIEPWPYGSGEVHDGQIRYFQALIFARDTRSGNPDTNFYAYPLPIIPIMDAAKKEIVRIEELATGGKGDGFTTKTHVRGVLDHCEPAEYVPELVKGGVRGDLKPLTVVQSEGPSFAVDGEGLVRWQKWKLRVSFNPREGAVVHDVRFDGRDILYRMSMSDMTVPYADPRPPFHRKQAFDFGDGGLGDCVNNLTLGCDCLGVIKYFDGVLVNQNGTARVTKNVICLHEVDNGVNWKHTNWRTNRTILSRRRELHLQFSLTLANYDYIFTYKFDQSGCITLETRATGIVSVVNIDPGKTSSYGTVVSPGTLAQNHQHIFCARIDPSIDGPLNSVLTEESRPLPVDPASNPRGNAYEVVSQPVRTSMGMDANPFSHRVFKIVNPGKVNRVSGRNVSYTLLPPATQLLLAHPESTQARRARFAQHHVWVTKYRDDELYAGGRYTYASKGEVGGVGDAADRCEDVSEGDVVVWCVWGITHNPRTEDWPVMPVEIMEVKLRPGDFFEGNPALDASVVGGDQGSRLVDGCEDGCGK